MAELDSAQAATQAVIVIDRINYMVDHGSSLTINWGEDNGCFEVEWITGGERFRGVSRNMQQAMGAAIEAAIMRFGSLQPSGIA